MMDGQNTNGLKLMYFRDNMKSVEGGKKLGEVNFY